MPSFFLLAPLLFAHLSHAVTQTCVWNSGDVADGYIPCGNSSITSGNCCHQDEVCLSSGLCYGNAGLIYRGACINEWGGDCVTYCDDISASWANLYPCAYPNSGSSEGPKSYWCGAPNSTVCSETEGHIIKAVTNSPVSFARSPAEATSLALEVLGTSTGTPSSSTMLAEPVTATITASGLTRLVTTTPTSSPASASSDKPSPTAGDSQRSTNSTSAVGTSHSRTGLEIGLGVGLGVFALLSLISGFVFYRMYRRQQQQLAILSSGQMYKQAPDGTTYSVYPPNLGTEMDGRSRLAEMGPGYKFGTAGTPAPVEIGGGR